MFWVLFTKPGENVTVHVEVPGPRTTVASVPEAVVKSKPIHA